MMLAIQVPSKPPSLWVRLKGVALDRLKGWPPMSEDFAAGRWGAYCWDVAKPILNPGDGPSDVCRYLQSVLNRYENAGVPVTGVADAATEAAVRTFQAEHKLAVDGQVGSHTWDMVDWVAFRSFWKQYRGVRVNKYSHLPVDDHGLTRETSFIECLVRANFPDLSFSRNWMVDRKARGQTFLSQHAYGNALDLRFGKDTVNGQRVADWVGMLETRLGLLQVIYNHNIEEHGVWRRLLPKSLQHTDHIHITCNSGKRPKV